MKKAKYKKHEIPEAYVEKWQKNVDFVAEIYDVPVALIMRVLSKQIEVLVTSNTDGNPYEAYEKADLETGLYCEAVMETRE
ncbi:MAG: hypothetical protein GY755_09245 [Chloroflexi bacterium]|nr:hypothetical protein [Chloroflexota bacterium]